RSIFFFSSRRRHTRLQGDWSSDVCSSDLYGRNHNAPWDTRSCPEERQRPQRQDEHETEEFVDRDDRVGPPGPDREAQQDEQRSGNAQRHVNGGDGSAHEITSPAPPSRAALVELPQLYSYFKHLRVAWSPWQRARRPKRRPPRQRGGSSSITSSPPLPIGWRCWIA